jgi:hypothetical protein
VHIFLMESSKVDVQARRPPSAPDLLLPHPANFLLSALSSPSCLPPAKKPPPSDVDAGRFFLRRLSCSYASSLLHITTTSTNRAFGRQYFSPSSIQLHQHCQYRFFHFASLFSAIVSHSPCSSSLPLLAFCPPSIK